MVRLAALWLSLLVVLSASGASLSLSSRAAAHGAPHSSRPLPHHGWPKHRVT